MAVTICGFPVKHTKRQTAAVYRKALEDIVLLRSMKVGREVYYLNVPLLEILKE